MFKTVLKYGEKEYKQTLPFYESGECRKQW